MWRPYLVDFWLFLRKVWLNLVAILLVWLLSAMILYQADAWPDAPVGHYLVYSLYMMVLEAVPPMGRLYLTVFVFALPAISLLLAAEGVVGAAVMFIHKSQRQGEWNAVIASTYKGHTVLCGLGQLGSLLCDGLHAAGRQLVVVDVDEDTPAMTTARRRGIPVIIGDMTRRDTLAEANVAEAACVIVCGGDDLANLEAATASREMNDTATVYARVLKKSLADQINKALRHDIISFSPYTAAAETLLGELGARAPDGASASEGR